jgi:hypothetical protein
MPKILHAAWISNFCTFLQIFIYDFKHLVLSRLDELLGVPYMVRKLEISSFQTNLNRRQIPPLAPNSPKQYTKVLSDKFDKICLVSSTLWNNMFPNSMWYVHLSKYSSMCLVFSCKILACFDVRYEKYAWFRKTS